MLFWVLFSLLVIAILILIVLLLWDKISPVLEKHFQDKRVYRILRYLCDEQDYLLLNNVQVKLPQGKGIVHFDHILFAEKYIYVIDSFFGQGGLYGNIQDVSLFLQQDNGKKEQIENPVLKNEQKVADLSEKCGLNPEDKMMVSVVVYNDSLIVPAGIGIKEQGSFFLPLKELEKTIKVAEKDNVEPIKSENSERLLDHIKQWSDKLKWDEKRNKR